MFLPISNSLFCKTLCLQIQANRWVSAVLFCCRLVLMHSRNTAAMYSALLNLVSMYTAQALFDSTIGRILDPKERRKCTFNKTSTCYRRLYNVFMCYSNMASPVEKMRILHFKGGYCNQIHYSDFSKNSKPEVD